MTRPSPFRTRGPVRRTSPGSGSLYRFLAERGHRPVRATQRLSAVSLDTASAGLLDVPRGAAALLMERTSYREDDRAVEYTRSLYRGDTYDFVAELRDGKVMGIEEKPENPKSDYAVTGIYFYDSKVFDYIRDLTPSNRGEFEISEVNNRYISMDAMHYSILEGWWTDAGTPSSYRLANQLVNRENV
jgi:hypothetical protein